MNYSRIKKTDIANGTGVRVSLFVSGCHNRCKGCFQPETWDFDYGHKFTSDTMYKILRAVSPDYIEGLTVLGGDPLAPENVPDVTKLCRLVKDVYPDKTIWVYTGYYWEDVKYLEMMDYIDVLVDSPFEEDFKDISLNFRGSSNQRIIDVPISLERGEIMEVKV